MVPVVLYPTSVQGASAATEIMQALGHAVNRNECDVLLMTRGGGSIEDLWPFNDEQLAKAIYDCPIPIISGVGHEIDFTMLPKCWCRTSWNSDDYCNATSAS